MKSAIPAEELVSKNNHRERPQSVTQYSKTKIGENLTQPSYPNLALNQRLRRATVPETTGKVFFTYKGKNYVCSGASINGPTKNAVATAGHCVHGGKGKGWHQNIAFAPGYYNGLSSSGLRNWKTAHTFQGWINSSDDSRDQAFFTVYPRNGRNLDDTVGGNGLSYNYSQNQSGVGIWGWPAESPYNGEIPYYCDGDTRKRFLFPSDMVISCSLTGGASGGLGWCPASVQILDMFLE